MTQDLQQKSPNEVLAEELVRGLLEAGLISEDHESELERKLKAEGVTQDDWNLWIDLATAPDRAEENNDE
ncbi:MAG: hypothetical protein JRJ15_02710 [Deltaproteobacteria bacterium]|nr:hypothetical protein [Deltaproteobacteria bacterium]